MIKFVTKTSRFKVVKLDYDNKSSKFPSTVNWTTENNEQNEIKK